MRQCIVIGNLHRQPLGKLLGKFAEHALVFGFAGAKCHDSEIFPHKLVRYQGEQIEPLLVREARDDADQRASEISLRQLELVEQITFANLLTAQVLGRISRRDESVHLRIPNRIIHAIQDAHKMIRARAHHTIQTMAVFGGLDLLSVLAAYGGQIIAEDEAAFEALLVRQAQALGRQLMVGHILEYHPAILELNRRVRAGQLGTLQYVYSNRLNLGKVRREENILWSFAPHDIAVILRLVGDLPLEVCATGGAYLQPNIADVTITNLLFDKGVRGHIFVSWLHPYKEQKLVVVGSASMAVFDDTSPDRKLTVYDQGIDWVDGQPVPRKKDGEVVPLAKVEPLKAEAEQFLHSIRSGEPPITDGASALANLEVLQAAQRSLSLHGQPVALALALAPARAWETL